MVAVIVSPPSISLCFAGGFRLPPIDGTPRFFYAPSMPSERSIVNAISRRLKDRGVWHFKVHGSAYQRAGIPDIVGCCRGRFFAFEVKRPGEDPTKIQRYEMMRLAESGAIVGVARSVEDAEEKLKTILDI